MSVLQEGYSMHILACGGPDDQVRLFERGTDCGRITATVGHRQAILHPVLVHCSVEPELIEAGPGGLPFPDEDSFVRWSNHTVKVTPPFGTPHRCLSCGR